MERAMHFVLPWCDLVVVVPLGQESCQAEQTQMLLSWKDYPILHGEGVLRPQVTQG